MEVCVGHFVIPVDGASTLAVGIAHGEPHEPIAKKRRVDVEQDASKPLDSQTTNEDLDTRDSRHGHDGDVVVVTGLAEKNLRNALHRYALHALEHRSQCAALSGNCVEVLERVQGWCRESSSCWPVVVSPPLVPTAPSWTTWSFSFVPDVLPRAGSAVNPMESTSTDDGEALATTSLCVDEVMRDTLASIPLPRGVCVSETKASPAPACVTAVLAERVVLPATSRSCTSTATGDAAAVPLTAPSSLLSRAITSKPLLLVGAGGIGCEVLKVLVLSGFSQIHLIDLDTIDATNLNRQFLFQLPDVGHSKAETARRVVLEWFDRDTGATHARQAPRLVAYHDNIKADRFDDAFYLQFAAVLNALDNVSARQHVNRMCMRTGVPLIESGTMGYNGQVQPIAKGIFECYDCRPKPPDTKTFAVCTIHARPTTMVHCVHYAKELYEVLFGSGAGGGSHDGGPHEEQGGSAEQVKPIDGGELAYLRTLIAEWRDAHEDSTSVAQLGGQLLRQLFFEKVEELLALKSAWPTEPPVPLEVGEVERAVAAYAKAQAYASSSPTNTTPRRFSFEEVLSLPDCLEMFVGAVEACFARAPGQAFRKDDDAAVRLVSATANLRAHVFHIPEQSLEEIRSVAGSIVPAIATTNAIIAAAVVHELVALLTASPASERSEAENKITSTHAGASQCDQAVSSSPTTTTTTAAALPHVVYARKVPQTRRRRLPSSVGLHHLSFSLFVRLTAHSTVVQDEHVSVAASALAMSREVRSAALELVGTTSRSDGRMARAIAALAGCASPSTKPRSVTDAYLVHSTCPNTPNALHCVVCQDIRPEVLLQLSLDAVTLGQLVHVVLEDAIGLEGPSVCHGTMLLYEDEDYESLAASTLAELLRPPSAYDPTDTTTAPPSVEEPASSSSVVSQQQQQQQQPHRFVLSVDALNKEVAWSVVLVDATSANVASGAEAAEEIQFALIGLAQAQAAEQRALRRLADLRRLREIEDSAARKAREEEGVANATAASVVRDGKFSAMEVILTDEDDISDVEEVVADGAQTATTSNTIANATNAGSDTLVNEEENDVVVLE